MKTILKRKKIKSQRESRLFWGRGVRQGIVRRDCEIHYDTVRVEKGRITVRDFVHMSVNGLIVWDKKAQRNFVRRRSMDCGALQSLNSGER